MHFLCLNRCYSICMSLQYSRDWFSKKKEALQGAWNKKSTHTLICLLQLTPDQAQIKVWRQTRTAKILLYLVQRQKRALDFFFSYFTKKYFFSLFVFLFPSSVIILKVSTCLSNSISNAFIEELVIWFKSGRYVISFLQLSGSINIIKAFSFGRTTPSCSKMQKPFF